MKNIKIGLALGSGRPRGFAHIGVLQALEEGGIKIDMISGSSIGSVIAAYYSLNGSVKGLEEKMLAQAKINVLKLVDYKINKGIINQKKVVIALTEVVGLAKFRDTKIPLYINATNLDDGKTKSFHHGTIIDAVHASCSMPLVFKPLRYNHELFADGAISDPVPIEVLRQAGADFIIAVNLYNKHEFKKEELNAASTLVKSGRILMYHLAAEKSKAADYLININLSEQVKKSGIKYLFSEVDNLQAINVGRKEGKKALKIIKQEINNKNVVKKQKT